MEEVMSKLVQWATKLMLCLPLPQQHEVQLMDGPHFWRDTLTLHICRFDAPETLETQLSCIQRDLGSLRW